MAIHQNKELESVNKTYGRKPTVVFDVKGLTKPPKNPKSLSSGKRSLKRKISPTKANSKMESI